jgi:quinoprotein glucose dehydrogenase
MFLFFLYAEYYFHYIINKQVNRNMKKIFRHAGFMKIVLLIFLILLAFPGLTLSFPKVGKAPQNGEEIFLPEGRNVAVQVWVENLDTPWSLIFISDDNVLVSERSGNIRFIKKGELQETPYARIPVAQKGEGGLMGIAAHPEFTKNPYIYAMHTYSKGENLQNRIIRLKHLGEQGVFDKVILDDIPGARFHNGGRIAFGPDGMLYIATGENFDADLAQKLNSLAGKILRITPDGSVPGDNPFKDSPVYSYGHRNPQGLSWHPDTGDLFASEHGPSGEYLTFANDEINIIKKGFNYGWPEAIGAPGYKHFVDPLIVWKNTTPPSGMTFYTENTLSHLRGNLFVATLRSQSLIRIRLDKEGNNFNVLRIERWFHKKYGRIRDVAEGPDGFIYFLTNNRDGRGKPQTGDDRIYRIIPAKK